MVIGRGVVVVVVPNVNSSLWYSPYSKTRSLTARSRHVTGIQTQQKLRLRWPGHIVIQPNKRVTRTAGTVPGCFWRDDLERLNRRGWRQCERTLTTRTWHNNQGRKWSVVMTVNKFGSQRASMQERHPFHQESFGWSWKNEVQWVTYHAWSQCFEFPSMFCHCWLSYKRESACTKPASSIPKNPTSRDSRKEDLLNVTD